MEWLEKIWHENRPFLLVVAAAGFILFWGQSTIANQRADATRQIRENERWAAVNEARELQAKEQAAALEMEWRQLNEDDNPAVARVTGLLFQRRPRFEPPEGNPVIAYGRLRSQVMEEARQLAIGNQVESQIPVGLDLPDTFEPNEADETYTRLDLTAQVVMAALEARVARIEGIRQIPRRRKRDEGSPLLETPVEVVVVGEPQAVQRWLHTFCRRDTFLEATDISVQSLPESALVEGRAVFNALEEAAPGEEVGARETEGVPELPGLPVLPGGG